MLGVASPKGGVVLEGHATLPTPSPGSIYPLPSRSPPPAGHFLLLPAPRDQGHRKPAWNPAVQPGLGEPACTLTPLASSLLRTI